jgi:hypothetical protein
MERLIEEKEVLVRSRRVGCSGISWLVGRLVGIPRSCLVGLQVTFLLTVLVLLISCTTLKKAGVTSLGAGGGAIVGSVLSSGAAAPILGATTGAFVTSAVTDLTITGKSKGKTMDNCAPDNFWTLLGDLASMGGWLLILVILIPMVLGWFLPGPVKLKGRDKPQISPYLK